MSVLTGPIIRTLDEGVRLAVEYYENNKAPQNVLDARKCTATAMLDFHKKANIFDKSIEAELNKLHDPSALVIEVAHQPNIFPYSGYYKKMILGKVLADKLREQLDVPVVLTFGFHDQDFANPKWFRRTELPDLYSQDGVLGLKLPVSRRSKKVMYAVPAPDDKQLSSWKTVLENWLTNNIRRYNKMVKGNHAMVGLEEGFMIDKDRSNMIRGRMRRVYELMEESQKAADTITEFNAFFGTEFSNEQFDTVAGLILNELGHMPERGEEVVIDNYQFKIISSSSRRINNLQVTLLPEAKSVSSGAA